MFCVASHATARRVVRPAVLENAGECTTRHAFMSSMTHETCHVVRMDHGAHLATRMFVTTRLARVVIRYVCQIVGRQTVSVSVSTDWLNRQSTTNSNVRASVTRARGNRHAWVVTLCTGKCLIARA